MAALLGATVPWLLTHDEKPPARPEAPVSPTDPGGSNGSGQQDISNSSTGQDGGDSSSGQDSGGTTGTPTPVGTKTRKGSWPGQRGSLTLTVTEVENQAGRIRLHVTADNGGGETVSLPLYGYFVVDDDTGHRYHADPNSGTWDGEVPAGGSLSGWIELEDFVQPEARWLTISFTHIFTFPAPQGGITVQGIPVPR
ncbi:hypothetical protein ACWDA7_37470 [Streptomyces sp. NPDC001156]